MKLRLPFEARDMNELVHMVLNTKPAPPPSYFAKEFKQLVAGMLAKSPNHRPSVKQIMALPFMQDKLKDLVEMYVFFSKHQQEKISSENDTVQRITMVVLNANSCIMFIFAHI